MMRSNDGKRIAIITKTILTTTIRLRLLETTQGVEWGGGCTSNHDLQNAVTEASLSEGIDSRHNLDGCNNRPRIQRCFSERDHRNEADHRNRQSLWISVQSQDINRDLVGDAVSEHKDSSDCESHIEEELHKRQ